MKPCDSKPALQGGVVDLALSIVRRRLRAMEMFHPDPERPRAPICKGRGNCEVSRLNRR